MSKSMLIGQDVQIRMSLKSSGRLKSVTAISNFQFQTNLQIITEKFLGEKHNRKDTIFEDVSGSFLVKPEDPEIFTFQQLMVQRAINRTATEDEVVLSWKYTFPNGLTATFTVPTAEFGTIPINAGGRDTHVEMPLTWEAESYQLNV
jgi:hypothetical protein